MRTVGEGTIKKLIVLALIFAGVIGVGTWYPAFAQGYELKNASKIACNSVIKIRFRNFPDDGWEEAFIRRARTAGVNLKPRQYVFGTEMDREADEYVCKAKIIYRTKQEWFLVGTVLALQEAEIEKRIEVEHRVRTAY